MKFLALVANGTEEIEIVTVVDFLRRMGVDVDLVSVESSRKVKGSHDIFMGADYTLDQIDPEDYVGVYTPGGLPGATTIAENETVQKIYQDFDNQGKIISAICAGPLILSKASVLKDRDFTCYPGFRDNIDGGNFVDERVVIDDNMITSQGPSTANLIAYTLVERLINKEVAEELKKETLYRD